MVSTDGKIFYLAGNLVEKTEGNVPKFDSEGERNFIYRSGNIKTHGRYIRFYPYVGSSPFVFIDELEVYEGEKELLAMPYKGSQFTGDDIPQEIIFNDCIKVRFGNDIQSVREKLEKVVIAGDIREKIALELDELSRQVAQIEINIDPKTFRAILPLNSFHQKIFALHGKILEAEGYKALTFWHRYRYSPLSLLEKPIGAIQSLEVKMMQDEYRAEVFNITNATDTPAKIRFAFKNLPNCVEVRQVEYVDTAEFRIDATALTVVPFENGEYETTVYGGMTRQIWLTFHPGNKIYGSYQGGIVITSDKIKETIPVNLHVSQYQLPDKIDLKVGVWDYAVNLINGITPANQSAVIRDLKEHRVNVAIGHRKQAAMPDADGIDANGHLIKPLDFTPFDKWIEMWNGAEHYQMFLAIRPESTFAGLKPGTAAFNTAVQEWAVSWDKHLELVNIKPKVVQFHFFDEPRKQDDYSVLRKWLEPFKAGSKMVEIFNDPVCLDESDNMKSAPEALSYCDTICPMTRQYSNYNEEIIGFFDKQVKDGKHLWLYSCDGPSRVYDPAYFRFQPWYCFKYGAVGSMIWVYSDYPNNWNEYSVIGGLSYSMVYLDQNSTTSTKHWEAFREGIEDYAYLCILKEKLKQASPEQLKKVSSMAVNFIDVNMIVQNIVHEVVKENYYKKGKENFMWQQESPCKIADANRYIILDILKILGSGTK
jgi:hypothetical protein